MHMASLSPSLPPYLPLVLPPFDMSNIFFFHASCGESPKVISIIGAQTATGVGLFCFSQIERPETPNGEKKASSSYPIKHTASLPPLPPSVPASCPPAVRHVKYLLFQCQLRQETQGHQHHWRSDRNWYGNNQMTLTNRTAGGTKERKTTTGLSHKHPPFLPSLSPSLHPYLTLVLLPFDMSRRCHSTQLPQKPQGQSSAETTGA